jgi:hypothetical protein
VITRAELGPEGLRRRIEEQDRQERELFFGQSSTDINAPLPGPIGFGGAVDRKTDASQRVLIDQERHRSLILDEVWRLYTTTAGRREVGKHVSVTRNPLQRTANALAVVYEREPVRKLGKGGSKKMARAWRDAVIKGARYNLRSEGWSRYAFLTNVVHVIPGVVDGRVRYETILPHAADVVFDAGETEPSILVYLTDGAGWTRTAVDAERFWYFDRNWALVGEVVHGYRDLEGKPMVPWVEWRTSARLDSMDYWKRGCGRQLVDATLKVGVVNAAKSAARQHGNAKQKVLSAQRIDEDVPPGQVLTSEHALMLRNSATLTAVDLIVHVTEFIEDMNQEFGELAENYGVPVGVIDTSRASSDGHAEFVAVAKQREKQAKHLRWADIQTSIKTAIIMRAEGHPATFSVDPAKFARAFQLKYQAHTFAERFKDRLENYKAAMSIGLMSQVDARMLEEPDEDRATAEGNSRETIKERNEFNLLLAQLNMPADAGQDGENIAQLAGRLGGQARGPTSTPDGNEDERRDQRPEQ